MRKIFLLGTFLLCNSLWYGCTTINDIVLVPNKKYEKVDPNEVVLYLTAKDLPENYEKVGVIYRYGVYITDKQIKKSRLAASQMGANGLYWENFNGNRNSYSVTGDTIVVGQQNNVGNYFIAIRTK